MPCHEFARQNINVHRKFLPKGRLKSSDCNALKYIYQRASHESMENQPTQQTVQNCLKTGLIRQRFVSLARTINFWVHQTIIWILIRTFSMHFWQKSTIPFVSYFLLKYLVKFNILTTIEKTVLYVIACPKFNDFRGFDLLFSPKYKKRCKRNNIKWKR